MAGRVLGDVLVVINPDATGFRNLADVQIRKQLAGFRPQVTLNPNTKELNAAITSIQARMKELNSRLSQLRISADSKPAEATIARLQARLATLTKQMSGMTMAADTKKLDAAIAAEQAKVTALQQRMRDLQLNADDAKAAAKIAALEKQAAALDKSLDSLEADVDVNAALTKLIAVEAELKLLKSNARAVQLNADMRSFAAQITASEALIAQLKAEASDIKLGANVDTAKLLTAEATLLGMEHTVSELGKVELPSTKTAMDIFAASSNRGTTAAAAGWRLLTGHITLFAGAFNKMLPAMFTSVAVWHLLLDAAVEIVAVWAPAIVAVTAFGAAASDAAREVFNRMTAANTVLDATGKTLPQLSTNFEKMHNAVRPQVYQLFGDALLVMNSRGGSLNKVITGTGQVLDQLAARMVYALTKGGGLNKFMAGAVTDVAKLGDSFANLGSIFASVFRAVPGYAEILLSVGDAVLHVLSVFTNAAEPVIAVGLALHGFFIYGGLAVTMSLGLVAGIVKLIGSFGKFNEAVTLVGYNALKNFALTLVSGIKSLVAYGGALLAIAGEEGVAAAGSVVLADAMTLLSRVPIVVWLTLTATLITGLVLLLRSAKSHTQQFVDGLQKTIAVAQLSDVLTTIQSAQTSVAQRLSAAQKDLANTSQYLSTQNLRTGQSTQMVSTAWTMAKGNVDALRQAQSQLSGQYSLVSSRVGALARQYGGNTQALGALNAAGITTSQILDKNSVHWAQALIQVDATATAYKAMGTQAGQLGNNLDVLGRTVTDQYQSVQKLNQGWDSFLSDLTGTQGSLDSVIQGYQTLNDHSGKLTISLGKLKAKYDDQKAAIDSLTPAGVALNQAFGDQVNNLGKLFDSFRTAGLANNLFTSGVKLAIAPLTKYAKGSQEATAQLVGLAQEAGYQGPISMQALTKWLGNTHDATKRLKDITDQATTQEALLTGAMQNQGNYIANRLIGDINDAILKYNGVEKAARAYGDAVARSGQQSDAAHQARATLVKDLINSGTAAHDTTGQIAALITKVTGIPPKEAIQIVMRGTGNYTINGAIFNSSGQPQRAATGLHPTAGATGGFVNRAGRIARAAGGPIDLGSGPTADDVPAMLSKGEYVIQAKSVAKYGKSTMDKINAGAYARGGIIPGYASGGAVMSGMDVLSGQFAVDMVTNFQNKMIATEVAQMKQALKSAVQAGISQAVGNVGSGVQRWAGLVSQALNMEGLNPGLLHNVLFQMQTESGGNPNAINLTDSNAAAGDPSRGLMQTIMSTFLAYHWPGTSFNIYDPLANISAALNYARHRYGPSLMSGGMGIGSGHGYALGGLVQALASGGSVSAFHSHLKSAQTGEYHDYLNYRKAMQMSLAGAKPGSYLSGHKVGIKGELATLAKKQSAEEAAYDAVFNKGATKAVMSHLNTALKSVLTTTHDKGLSYSGPGGHPGWLHGLQSEITKLEHIATGPVPAGATAGSGGPKLSQAAFMARLKSLQTAEYHDYLGLANAFKAGLRHPAKGSWLYKNRGLLGKDLTRLKGFQSAEEAGYDNILHHGTGLPNLAKEIGRINTELGALKAGELSHLPGGHPGWVKGLKGQLTSLDKLLAVQPYNAPWAPGNLGPVHTALPGVETFDRGGYLRPGLNLAWNGTGKMEPVGNPGGDVHLHLHNNGVIGSQAELESWFVRMANHTSRTGKLTQAVRQANR